MDEIYSSMKKVLSVPLHNFQLLSCSMGEEQVLP